VKAPPADFYENDEDPEEVLAAFNRAAKGYTQAPFAAQSWTTATTFNVIWSPGVEPNWTSG
jgi:hypothetical protein